MRLGVAFAFLALSLLATVALGRWQRTALEHSLHELGEVELQKIRLVDQWIALSDLTSLRLMAVNKSTEQGIADLFGPQIAPGVQAVGELFKQVQTMATSDEETAFFVELTKKRETLLAALKDVSEYKKVGDVASSSAMFDSAFMPAQVAYNAEIKRFGELQHQLLTKRVERALTAGDRNDMIVAAIVAVLITAATVLAWRTARRIKHSLDQAVMVARRVAEGDLSHRVALNGSDEFGQLMQALADMTGALDKIVRDVRTGTEGIALASNEIAQGNSDLSHRTEQQAGNVQQTASAMEELSGTVNSNANTAERAHALSQRATEIATRGGQVVSQVVNTMSEISASSKRIEEIISVIDGISFQTNILALNAAVEAARAGVQGRGFAVVANEVRSLAHRSADAAKEIKALIVDSVGRVSNGTAQVRAAGETMTEIVAAIRSVGELMGEINAASAQQTAGLSEISASVSSIDQTTQQNAALVEQAAAAAESLRQQAISLERSVAVFRISAMDDSVQARHEGEVGAVA